MNNQAPSYLSSQFGFKTDTPPTVKIRLKKDTKQHIFSRFYIKLRVL